MHGPTIAPASAVDGDAMAAPEAPPFGNHRRTAMLFMLAFVYSLNYLDRQIVIILQEPIKRAFGLADWELGLLTGGAFGVFYTSMGVPIALVIDRGINRVRLIAGFTAVWSLMTALCGITRNFAQFFGARMGVGLAEAGFAPAAHSLISDMYAPKERSGAAGIFALGVPIGVMAGLSLGGIVAQATDWRTALLVAGVPGLIAAALFPLLAREPARGAMDGPATRANEGEAKVGFAGSLRILARRGPFVHIVAGSAAIAFAQSGIGSWLPSFLIRSHGMSLAHVGVSLGLLTGVCAGLGTWLGGWQGTRFGKKGLQGAIWIPVAGMVLCAPSYIAVVMLEDGNAALWLLIVPITLGALWTAPSIALTQSLAPVAMRARASAVYIVAANLVGVSMGPLVAGVLSDWLTQFNGGDAARGLRDAMIVLTAFFIWGAAHWLVAARGLTREARA